MSKLKQENYYITFTYILKDTFVCCAVGFFNISASLKVGKQCLKQPFFEFSQVDVKSHLSVSPDRKKEVHAFSS